MYNSSELIKLLKKENYNIKVHEHGALFTVKDSKKLRGKIEGAHSKNLFLKNKKNKFLFLLIKYFVTEILFFDKNK